MSSPDLPRPSRTMETVPTTSLTRWQRLCLIIKVIELRLRFVALMAITGLVFIYWDTIWNQYDKWTRPSIVRDVASSTTECFCPMHPNVIREDAGNCPVCGMPLSNRKKGETEILAEGVTARVALAPFRIRQAGIQTVEIGYLPLAETLTTVGTVEYDERRLAQVASPLKGLARVESLKVNYTGMAVKAGETLGELASPELTQSVVELVLAQRPSAEPARSQTPPARSGVPDARELTRQAEAKLRLLGVPQSLVVAILAPGKKDAKLPIIAPISGVVFKKNVVEGQYVTEGQALFEIADLSTVWVKAHVYEDQLGSVRVGQPVEAIVRANPSRRSAGQVAFIQPRVDPATRTIEVRCDLENQDQSLRPGMFATVMLKTVVAESPLFHARSVLRRGVEGRHAPQTICPVSHAKLGSMGDPIAIEFEGRKFWLCCAACTPKFKSEPGKYLARLAPSPADGVLSVPESAVIDTGSTKVVYVETEPGVYEGRRVELGPRSGDQYSVLVGLVAGEKVATAGAFLIDAETRINPATRGRSSGAGNAYSLPIPEAPPVPARPTPLPLARPAEEAILRSAPTLELP